jgi:SAM-dependent methyltransferase
MNSTPSTFYNEKLSQFGDSAKGVGWKDENAQIVRFEQLIKIISKNDAFSINDLGCGTGAFANYLKEKKSFFTYNGYDIMPEMIDRAVTTVGNTASCSFSVIDNAAQMSVADYTIASGIFNLMFGKKKEEWLQYILDTIAKMNEKSRHGFAFNALTMYSDPEFMKDELYYSDPTFLFDYCKTKFSKNVALLHDYNQYDFTILVRKNL